MEQRKQYVKNPGTYTATLSSVAAQPSKKDPNATELVLEFKTTQGEYIGKKFPWPEAVQSRGQNFYFKKMTESLGLKQGEKLSSKVGSVVNINVTPFTLKDGKQFMSVESVSPATTVQSQAVSAASQVFDV